MHRKTKAIALFLLALSTSYPFFAQQSGLPLPSVPSPDAAGNYKVGNGVSAPKVAFAPEPEFSILAQKKGVTGTCSIALVVDSMGHPTQLHVLHSIADGQSAKVRKAALSLDQKALEAVGQYHFEPAMFHGKPVPVTMTIEVSFQGY